MSLRTCRRQHHESRTSKWSLPLFCDDYVAHIVTSKAFPVQGDMISMIVWGNKQVEQNLPSCPPPSTCSFKCSPTASPEPPSPLQNPQYPLPPIIDTSPWAVCPSSKALRISHPERTVLLLPRTHTIVPHIRLLDQVSLFDYGLLEMEWVAHGRVQSRYTVVVEGVVVIELCGQWG